MTISAIDIPLVTASDGTADVTVTSIANFGEILSVYAAKGTLEDTVDITLYGGEVGLAVEQILAISNLTASGPFWYYPYAQVVNNTSATVGFYVPRLFRGALRVVVAQGGNAKSGSLRVWIRR